MIESRPVPSKIRVACAVLAAAASCVVGGAPARAASQTADCPAAVRQVGSAAIADTTPVLFVHGMASNPEMWGTDSTGLAARVAAMTGATAWTFDYSAAALNWVDDPRIGTALAAAIVCLARGAGRQVVIVSHSMGGLATQEAVSLADPQGGTVADHVAEVITLGTPFLGSQILKYASNAVSAVEDSSAQDGILVEALLSACAGFAAPDNNRNPCGLLAVADSPVGSALSYKSPQIAALPAWPIGLPVKPIAGNITVRISVAGIGFTTGDVGDVAVTQDSAIAGADDAAVVQDYCDNTGIRQLALHSDKVPCYHDSLPSDPRAVDAVTSTIAGIVQAESAPSSGTAMPRVGTYPVNQVLYSDNTMRVTLTSLRVAPSGAVTSYVVYQNTSNDPLDLTCTSVSDASIDTLAGADGTPVPAQRSYCSDNPNLTFELRPGESETSYAVFTAVNSTGPFTFSWQNGSGISGSSANINLS